MPARPRAPMAFWVVAAVFVSILVLLLVTWERASGVTLPEVALAPADVIIEAPEVLASHSLAEPVRVVCPPVDAPDYYWPSGKFGVRERPREGDFLDAMAEFSLTCDAPDRGEVYRVLWLRTFHHPIAARVVLWPGGGEMTAVALTGSGGYDPGTIGLRTERALTRSEVESIRTALNESDFWRRSTMDSGLGGLDGAEWILEGQKDRGYHIVNRWSPSSGAFRDLCVLLLRMSGLDVEPIY